MWHNSLLFNKIFQNKSKRDFFSFWLFIFCLGKYYWKKNLSAQPLRSCLNVCCFGLIYVSERLNVTKKEKKWINCWELPKETNLKCRICFQMTAAQTSWHYIFKIFQIRQESKFCPLFQSKNCAWMICQNFLESIKQPSLINLKLWKIKTWWNIRERGRFWFIASNLQLSMKWWCMPSKVCLRRKTALWLIFAKNVKKHRGYICFFALATKRKRTPLCVLAFCCNFLAKWKILRKREIVSYKSFLVDKIFKRKYNLGHEEKIVVTFLLWPMFDGCYWKVERWLWCDRFLF